MPLTSTGYGGEVDAKIMGQTMAMASRRCVQHVAAWQVSQVDGLRQIVISPGVGYHSFVRVETTEPTVRAVDPAGLVEGGGRFHLLVMRRDWRNKTSDFYLLPGEIRPTSLFYPLPVNYPASYVDEPGDVQDQPLYWVFVNGNNTDIQVIDLRRLADGRPTALLASGGVWEHKVTAALDLPARAWTTYMQLTIGNLPDGYMDISIMAGLATAYGAFVGNVRIFRNLVPISDDFRFDTQQDPRWFNFDASFYNTQGYLQITVQHKPDGATIPPGGVGGLAAIGSRIKAGWIRS